MVICYLLPEPPQVSLPAVVAVAALDKLHILPVALINDEIFGAGSTMKP
jgi:hypothetical protein